jgi:hypothetical protein
MPTNRSSEIDALISSNGNNAAVSPNTQRVRIIVDASARIFDWAVENPAHRTRISDYLL